MNIRIMLVMLTVALSFAIVPTETQAAEAMEAEVCGEYVARIVISGADDQPYLTVGVVATDERGESLKGSAQVQWTSAEGKTGEGEIAIGSKEALKMPIEGLGTYSARAHVKAACGQIVNLFNYSTLVPGEEELLLPAPPERAGEECTPRSITYTNGPDVEDGTDIHEDTMIGRNGDDTLRGLACDDTIIGNRGEDSLHGNEGNDSLDGRRHNDKLWGNKGNDTLDGGSGDDVCWGGFGVDSFQSCNIMDLGKI